MNWNNIIGALALLVTAMGGALLVRCLWSGRLKYEGRLISREEIPRRYWLEIGFDFLNLLVVAGFALLFLRPDLQSSYSFALLTASVALNFGRDVGHRSRRFPGPNDRLTGGDILVFLISALFFAAAVAVLWLWLDI